MKRSILFLALGAALALSVPAAMAADKADTKPTTAKKVDKKKDKKADAKEEAPAAAEQAAGNVVGEALKGVNFITDTKPRYDAEFYLYLTTAGWCGPCNREMPNVVKQYPLMLKKNVQLIMISADQQPEAATHFMKRNRGDFPCIMGNPTTETQKLPGYRDTHAVPQAILVDAAGNVITVGPAQGIISNWAKLIKKK
mgnify:CR=1 FL=1